LFAAALLANELPAVREQLEAFRRTQTESVLAMSLPEQP
jgi:5-(carboxyamino)imidazole ribonucleotide mutase